jgi:hypothetical protein
LLLLEPSGSLDARQDLKRVSKVLQDRRVLRANKDPQDLKAERAKALRGRKGLKEQTASRALQGRKAQRASKALRGRKGNKDRKALRASQALPGNKERKALRENQALRGNKGRKALRANQVRPVPLAKQVPPGQQACMS